jgi:hypothetical protein
MTLLIHLATLIFVVGLGKQFLDTKCQENYEQGVIDSTKGFKIELEDSIRESFRVGIEKGKEDYLFEYELESDETFKEKYKETYKELWNKYDNLEKDSNPKRN